MYQNIACYRFEKLFSGHYIGDLARLTMLKFIEEHLLLNPEVKDVFNTWGVITANHLSDIERYVTDGGQFAMLLHSIAMFPEYYYICILGQYLE